MGSNGRKSDKSSSNSVISCHHMEMLVEKFLNKQTHDSTLKTYVRVWHQFNDFLLKLDVMPSKWEQRTTLYIAHLIENGKQSSSIKSYVSAIKKSLILDKYNWKDNEL